MRSPTDAGRPATARPSRLSPGLAAAIGLMHGPAELIPISSSGHITLLPWLAGRDLSGLDPELRKALEVMLHAGTAAALLIVRRAEIAGIAGAVRHRRSRRGAVILLATVPPAAVGLLLGGVIERRLGTPATIAAGLAAGSVAMAAADRAPQERRSPDATAVDGLWLGLAQTCALMPGISRNGATLAVARARGFRRPDAAALSREIALPVIAGATALTSLRLIRRGLPPGAGVALGAGAAGSFASTLAGAGRLDRALEGRALLPVALYRLGLAGIAAVRLRTTAGSRTERTGSCTTMAS